MTSFDDDDEVVVVGERLPRLVAIAPMDGFNVAVTWEDGTRPKTREVVDLGPALFRYKVYAPLRDNSDLFRSVRLQEHRFGVAWGERGDIDMGASTIADLADETMTAEDFAAFMERHGFTLDRVAAELGISRRMAAYYRKEHKVPRTVALACAYIDLRTKALPNIKAAISAVLNNLEPLEGVSSSGELHVEQQGSVDLYERETMWRKEGQTRQSSRDLSHGRVRIHSYVVETAENEGVVARDKVDDR